MTRPGSIISIQILRGIAALFVVIGHTQGMGREFAALSNTTFTSWQPIPWGVGVDLFFVISGFIIFYSSKKYVAGDQPRQTFFIHRIARLVPLYWTCTCLALGLTAAKKALGFAQAEPFAYAGAIIASLLFLPIYGPGNNGLAFPVYNLGWTLNYEMFFYALFALCLGQSHLGSAGRVLTALGIVVAFGLISATEVLPLAFWAQPIVLEFGVGIVIAVLHERVSLPPLARIGLIAAGAALILLMPFGSPPEIDGTNLNGLPRFVTMGIPAALVIAGAALGRDISPARWLTVPVEIGNASYSLYLIHPFVIFAVSVVFRRSALFAKLPLPVLVLAVILLASVVAIISYHRFERPSARAVAQFFTPARRKLAR
ncbi:acyltransferase [Bradyrhizobium sp. BR 10289]|uniref:acyltransferase family protein n=1 Tax=Bradyrhizobium sp. BR 10289 TaxID=2749993 RepID=UPI001C64B406|nr:acyltransferase [Bradyrhizobium sp. BR 10289]